MPKSDGDSGQGKGIHIDEKSLAMFMRNLQESAKPPNSRLGMKELADEFEVSERTFARRVETVQRAMDELKKIESVYPASKPVLKEPVETRKREPTKDPGPLSRQAMQRQQGGRKEETALTTTRQDEYAVIKAPTSNPLDGLSEGQISQAGVAVGIVFGGGLAKMGKALSDTHRPLGERAMEMAQGSNAVACGILGIFESLRAFGVIEDGSQRTGRRTRVIDGTLVGNDDDEAR
jgi:hypothetical protein